MNKSISRLLDKIDNLEAQLHTEKLLNINLRTQSNIEQYYYKGIKILELYDFYMKNKKG